MAGSNLKHLNVVQLRKEVERLQVRYDELSTQCNNVKVRLDWAKKYLEIKTPVKMTFEEIEAKLGHKVNLV